MLLSILVDIFNIEKTFLFALCFITSETTASFDFMEQQLNDLFFHDCPRQKVIYADFVKGLVSAIAKREAQHQDNGHDQTYILQQCEWHRIQAIKRHFVVAEKYPKEVRDKIIDLIWK